MATDVLPLPGAHILDDIDAATPATPLKPPLMRRLFDAMIEAQTRRAQIEIRRVLGSRALQFTASDPSAL